MVAEQYQRLGLGTHLMKLVEDMVRLGTHLMKLVEDMVRLVPHRL